MSSEPILVLGGTGQTGQRVVAQLRRSGLSARVASRWGQRFDWGDERTWAPALDCVRSVFVVTIPGPALRTFSELAVASGVEWLVLLSARAWQYSGGDDLLASERAVKDVGGNWTILRPTWFAQNFSEEPFLRDAVLAGEDLLSTGDGPVPFVDAEDIAAVAVAALTQDGDAGQIYELSGPRLLTFGAAVQEVALASGRDIRYVPFSGEQAEAHLTKRGFPPKFAAFLNDMFSWVDQGKEAHLAVGVQHVLRREPRDFSDYVKRTVPTGAWNARPASRDESTVRGVDTELPQYNKAPIERAIADGHATDSNPRIVEHSRDAHRGVI